MKKILIICLILIMAVPIVQARRRVKRAGKVKDNVFTDAKFDYSINVPKDWKYSIQKAEENFRFIFIKDNYQIPPDYIQAPDYTKIPKIVMWVDTSTMSPFSFVDSLISEDYESDQKGEIKEEFDILYYNISQVGNVRDKLITRLKKADEFDGNKAVIWKGIMNYTKDVAESSSSVGGVRVKGAFGGSIIAIKKDNNLYVFHMMCEENYFDINFDIFLKNVKSMKWKK